MSAQVNKSSKIRRLRELRQHVRQPTFPRFEHRARVIRHQRHHHRREILRPDKHSAIYRMETGRTQRRRVSDIVQPRRGNQRVRLQRVDARDQPLRGSRHTTHMRQPRRQRLQPRFCDPSGTLRQHTSHQASLLNTRRTSIQHQPAHPERANTASVAAPVRLALPSAATDTVRLARHWTSPSRHTAASV